MREIKKKLKKVKIFDFGVGLEHNTFKFNKDGAILPRLFTLVYALSIATSGKSKRILSCISKNECNLLGVKMKMFYI